MLAEKSWRLESMLLLGTCLFGCMLLAAVANTLLRDSGDTLGGESFRPIVISAVCLHLMTFPAVHLFLREERSSWADAFGFRSPRSSRALLLAVGVCVAALPVAWLLAEISGRVMQSFGEERVLQPAVTAVQNSEGWVPQVGLGIIAILLAPTAEEILFRGILYPFVKQHGHPHLALWSTALLFGAVHFNLMTFVPLVFFGVALAWLYERTGNLLAPMLAHSLFNLANFFSLVMAHA